MATLFEVKVPDIGDFKDVPVIEVLVKPGDVVKPEDALVTLESDKATMDVPSPAEEMSSMATDPRRKMSQAWRNEACLRSGEKCGVVSMTWRSVGETTKVRRYASIVRAYQINGESRFLSIEEAL
jgi:hypothetical protein